jgi:hypothetical protein
MENSSPMFLMKPKFKRIALKERELFSVKFRIIVDFVYDNPRSVWVVVVVES